MTTTDSFASDTDDAPDPSARRVRSKISFPYTPLSDAEQVAQALHRRGGSASMDELAAELGQVTTSGAFRTKVATARTFGVASVRRGTATLTTPGHELLDTATAAKARVDAFLTVALYRRIYEQFKGVTLPPPAGLEAAMERHGVSPKQTERARQAFQRSAEQAGFFGNGPDRLVSPAVGPNLRTDEPAGGRERSERSKQRRGSSASTLPAAVEAAWITLLDEGEAWSPDEVVEWVALARRQRAFFQKREG